MSPLILALWAIPNVPFLEPPAVTLEDFTRDAATLERIYPQDDVFPFADDEGYVYAKHLSVGLGTTADSRCVAEDDASAIDGSDSCKSVRACWHPSDPVATRRYLYTGAGGTVVWKAGLVLGSPSGGADRLLKCTRDGFAFDTPVRVAAGVGFITPPWQRAPTVLGRRLCGFWNRTFFEGPINLELACMAGPEDYAVFGNGAPDFKGTTLFKLVDLDGHLGIPPLATNADGSPILVRTPQGTLTEAVETWLVPDAQLLLPDGRFIVSLIRQSAVARPNDAGLYQNSAWHFILPADTTGLSDLRVLRRPDWPLRKPWPGGSDPDLALGRPFYDHLNDLVVFDARGQEFGNDRFTIDDVDDVPRGYFGNASYGFWVLDLDAARPVLGYVSATDAGWSKAMDYFNRGNFSDGAVLVPMGEALVWRYGASPYTPTREYLVHLHPELFDLDWDGLTAAEETALGTSDHDRNSDDDYVTDRVERDLGFDPSDPLEQPIPEDGWGALQTTTSALIAKRFKYLLPEPWRTTGSASAIVRSHAAHGPLCALDAEKGPPSAWSGTCWDAAGQVVALFPHPPVADRAMAYDGRHIVTLSSDQTTLESFDLETTKTSTIGVLTVPELDTGAFLRIFPVDDTTVFVQRAVSVNPALWVVKDGVQTQVFDLAAAELAAGQTTPAPAQVKTMGLLPTHFEVLGFVPDPHKTDTVELLVAVQGYWRRYILAITPEGRIREHLRFYNEGLGDLVSAAESAFGLWTGSHVLGASGFIQLGGLRLFTGNTFFYRPVPAFGTLLVENRDPRALEQPQQSGLHEVVTFGPELEPGETLVFVSRWPGVSNHLPPGTLLPDIPAMLMRVHPRGGIVPAWSLAPITNQVDPARLEYDIVDVSGMDLDRRHHLCLADRGADTLRIYGPIQSGGVPEVLLEKLEIQDIRDCRWRSNGDLSILVESDSDGRIASQTLTRPKSAPRHAAAAFVADPADTNDQARRRAFVKGPGIDLELIPFGTTAYVAGPEANFARVEYDLASGRFSSPWGELTLENVATQDHPSIALRPDGRAVLLPSIVYKTDPVRAEPLVLVDPSTPSEPTTYVSIAAFNGGDSGRGMVTAVVPWDRFVDPWTGAHLEPSNPFGPTSTTPTFPGPTPPTGGTPIRITPPDDESCAASGPTTSIVVVVSLFFILVLRRKTRSAVRT